MKNVFVTYFLSTSKYIACEVDLYIYLTHPLVACTINSEFCFSSFLQVYPYHPVHVFTLPGFSFLMSGWSPVPFMSTSIGIWGEPAGDKGGVRGVTWVDCEASLICPLDANWFSASCKNCIISGRGAGSGTNKYKNPLEINDYKHKIIYAHLFICTGPLERQP